MSKIKQKSDFNHDAAKILIDKNYYAPSVHCSYYSCFQLMKFTIKDFFEISYQDLTNRIGSAKQNTHSYVIKYIGNEIRQNVDILEFREFNNKIRDLKYYREQSDYDNFEVTIDDGKKALKLADEIRGKLKNIFHV